jgi:hypothetical protein
MLQWRRYLFAWEYELVLELLEAVPMVARSEENDRWFWSSEESGIFSVKLAYLLLGRVFVLELDFGPNELRVLNNIWRSSAPPKVIAFSWKLLRNRIPTRVNLAVRGVQVAGGSLGCILCVGKAEQSESSLVPAVVFRLLYCWGCFGVVFSFVSFGLALSVCFSWYFLYLVFNKSLPYSKKLIYLCLMT